MVPTFGLDAAEDRNTIPWSCSSYSSHSTIYAIPGPKSSSPKLANSQMLM